MNFEQCRDFAVLILLNDILTLIGVSILRSFSVFIPLFVPVSICLEDVLYTYLLYRRLYICFPCYTCIILHICSSIHATICSLDIIFAF